MNCILIYDIPSSREGNRIRTKLADMCMDYGMNRIQYSAFSGDLLRTHQEELFARARKRLGLKPGKIFLYAIGEREWGQRLCHERIAIAPPVPAGDLETQPLPAIVGLGSGPGALPELPPGGDVPPDNRWTTSRRKP